MPNKEEKYQELQRWLQVLKAQSSTLIARILELSEQVSSLKVSAINSESYYVHETMIFPLLIPTPSSLNKNPCCMTSLVASPMPLWMKSASMAVICSNFYTPTKIPMPLFMLNLLFPWLARQEKFCRVRTFEESIIFVELTASAVLNETSDLAWLWHLFIADAWHLFINRFHCEDTIQMNQAIKKTKKNELQ